MECALDIWNGCRCIWQRFIVFARTYSGYWYMSWSWSRQEFEQGVSSGILQDMFGVMRSLMGNMEPTRYSVGARTCQLSLYSKNAFKQDMGDDWWKSLDTFLPGLQQCFRNHSTSEICASIWLCKCIKNMCINLVLWVYQIFNNFDQHLSESFLTMVSFRWLLKAHSRMKFEFQAEFSCMHVKRCHNSLSLWLLSCVYFTKLAYLVLSFVEVGRRAFVMHWKEKPFCNLHSWSAWG